MIQKGDDLINGAGQRLQPFLNQHFMHNQRNAYGSAQIVQAMSFEDLLSLGENMLPSVETVLPHYAIAIPTPPPSLPSPSVNITINATTTTATTAVDVTNNNQQFQLQHLAPQLYETSMGNINPQHQLQPVEFNHSTSSTAVQYHHMLNNTSNNNNGNTSISSTSGGQMLFVEHNNPNYMIEKTEPKHENDSIYVSDASTVDADDNLTDEPFTYLQNLNSDNLMKFSQQSALQQLIEEQMVEPKVNFNLIPTCEEHDIAGYDFRIEVNSADSHAQRPGVVYSNDTQRLYVKTNENVYIDCSYKVKMPIQPLHVRVFAVYTKDTSEPVLRCQNHISKDSETDEKIRNSLVRCRNPDTTYYGSDSGKSICDRYAVLVPLNASVKVSDSNDHMKQQLIINFTCNNSCMNRRQTSAVFVLEGNSGEVLAQRVLDVKISTCPKRDKRLYEAPLGSLHKRRPIAEPDFCESAAKMPRYDESCNRDDISRSSYDDPSDDEASKNTSSNGACSYKNDSVDVTLEKETGDFVLTLKYKTRQHLLQALRALYSNAITNEVFYEKSPKGKKLRETDSLRRIYEKALRMKGRPTSQIDCQ